MPERVGLGRDNFNATPDIETKVGWAREGATLDSNAPPTSQLERSPNMQHILSYSCQGIFGIVILPLKLEDSKIYKRPFQRRISKFKSYQIRSIQVICKAESSVCIYI